MTDMASFICGVHIEEIEDSLMKKIPILYKVVGHVAMARPFVGITQQAS
jgi:hypothetical protein